MDSIIETCRCFNVTNCGGEGSLETLATVRSQCGALLRVFLPDDVWPDFQKWHHQPDNSAYHRSVLLLALERGHLGRVTSPIHRYLIQSGTPKPVVRKQYLNDLRELWMNYSDPIERHKKSRIFLSRVVELQCAEWLEQQGWIIDGLEAIREGPDIEAYMKSGRLTAFEVKFVGTENDDFSMTVKSLAGRGRVASVSPYAAMNYLLFRAYEAGKQLEGIKCERIAILVIDDVTWWRFDWQLKNNWIDWARPKFFDADPVWKQFLAQQEAQYPNLAADLPIVIGHLDGLWILQRLYGYNYHLETEVLIRTT